MHDGMQYDPIQGQGEGNEPWNLKIHFQKVPHLPFTMLAGNWPLILKLGLGTISKFDRAGFLIFVLVFVSRDFEIGRNVSCEESTVSPTRG